MHSFPHTSTSSRSLSWPGQVAQAVKSLQPISFPPSPDFSQLWLNRRPASQTVQLPLKGSRLTSHVQSHQRREAVPDAGLAFFRHSPRVHLTSTVCPSGHLPSICTAGFRCSSQSATSTPGSSASKSCRHTTANTSRNTSSFLASTSTRWSRERKATRRSPGRCTSTLFFGCTSICCSLLLASTPCEVCHGIGHLAFFLLQNNAVALSSACRKLKSRSKKLKPQKAEKKSSLKRLKPQQAT